MVKRDPLIAALRQRRYDKGLTLRELSEITGFGMNSIWYWEAGRAVPHIKRMHIWAKALGVSIGLQDDDERAEGGVA